MAKADKVIKAGFFNMDTVTAVCKEKDLEAAKQIAFDRIQNNMDGATPENVRKAVTMVERSNSIKNLGLNISNFLLAHPSENLKTIR
jgi:hypothetical protein